MRQRMSEAEEYRPGGRGGSRRASRRRRRRTSPPRRAPPTGGAWHDRRSLEFRIAARQGDVSGIAGTVQGPRGVADGADRTQGRSRCAFSQTRVDLEQGLKLGAGGAAGNRCGDAAPGEGARRRRHRPGWTLRRSWRGGVRRRTRRGADRDAGPAAVRAREEARQVAAGGEAGRGGRSGGRRKYGGSGRRTRIGPTGSGMVQRLASTRGSAKPWSGPRRREQRDAAAAQAAASVGEVPGAGAGAAGRPRKPTGAAGAGDAAASSCSDSRRDREALAAAARAELGSRRCEIRAAIEQRIGRQLRDQRAERRALGEERKPGRRGAGPARRPRSAGHSAGRPAKAAGGAGGAWGPTRAERAGDRPSGWSDSGRSGRRFSPC